MTEGLVSSTDVRIRIAVAKEEINKKTRLLSWKLNLELRKRFTSGIVWGNDTWTLRTEGMSKVGTCHTKRAFQERKDSTMSKRNVKNVLDVIKSRKS